MYLTELSLTVSVIALVLIGAVLDVKSRRIPNWLTIGSFFLALAIRSFGGLESIISALVLAMLTLVIMLPLFAGGGFGGGDVKLLVAVAAHSTASQMIEVALYGSVAGVLIAIVGATRRREVLPLMSDVGNLAVSVATLDRRGIRRKLTAVPVHATVPYGAAVAVGVLAAWSL